MFANRRSAGRQLAARLQQLREEKPVVLALPRGGVPVGFEIAARLRAPLDIVLVRKIGHPHSPELAVGAIAEGDRLETFIDERAVADLGVSQSYLDAEIARQSRKITHRRRLYFKDRRPVDIGQRT